MLESVSVNIGDRRTLDGISFELDGGEYLAVVGPNGAGKTTLLRAIVGLLSYDGTMSISGRTPNPRKRRAMARLVAYVPQRPVLPDGMIVADYVMLGRSAHHAFLGVPSPSDRSIVSAVLDRLDLGRFANRAVLDLSGGEIQRVVLARSLAQQAPILILDEPTSALDIGHGQLVLELIDELRREDSLTVVCAMHDLTLAAQYAERILLLAHGRQVALGEARRVLTQENVERHFSATVEILDASSGPAVTPLRQALRPRQILLPPTAHSLRKEARP